MSRMHGAIEGVGDPGAFAEGAGFARGTILVVEDDRDLRETLAEVFLQEGFAVVQAADGLKALSRLRAGLLPRLILLDLEMPGLDGETFCEIREADPVLSLIPVIVYSAEEQARQLARRYDATHSVAKPAGVSELLDVAERCLR